jgi:2-oxoglutarate ferredoxin oxidoreductase subunit alpha
MPPSKPVAETALPIRRAGSLQRDAVTHRVCGDSGDGMQLAGAQFSLASAVLGNDVATLPDFPAEIRAAAGTLAGVSAFQVRFGNRPIHSPGDRVDTLVAMNPAALKANFPDLAPGGLLLVNADAFGPDDLHNAGYSTNPLEDGSLAGCQLRAVPINTLNRQAVAAQKLCSYEADRCKNFFALGLVFWLYERPLEPTLRYIRQKFAKNPAVMEANTRTLRAGYHYGETSAVLPAPCRVTAAPTPPGLYRRVSGNEALVLGLIAAAERADKMLVFAGYPIAPSTDVLHTLADLKRFGVRVLQAEDETAAAGAVIGAAFGGALGVTVTSGIGVCLKSEALGLAVSAELPLVVVNVQRGGPSTGLPSKTEQADLLQAMFGRNGESPLPVLAPATPADCFAVTLEAVRIAFRFMTPVVVLSDTHLACAGEPWRVPAAADLPVLTVEHPHAAPSKSNGHGAVHFRPYERDERLARPWALPGTPGLEHRLTGLEKEDGTGDVSYDPVDHEHMVRVRAEKVANIAADIPLLEAFGPETGDLLVIGWGSTFGAIRTAVERAHNKGLSVAHAHLRHLNPMPRNTGELLRRYRMVLVPELNAGQLLLLVRAAFLVDAVGLNKVQGTPFLAAEVEEKIEELLLEGGGITVDG